MSDTNPSRQRLIDNELLVRQANEEFKQVIEQHTPDEEQAELVINFYCECSALDCQERIALTLEQYQKQHARNDHFVIAPGHVTPSVEKVVETKQDFLIVEKYALPA